MRPDTDTLWLVADLPDGRLLAQPCATEGAVWDFLTVLADVVPKSAVWHVADRRPA